MEPTATPGTTAPANGASAPGSSQTGSEELVSKDYWAGIASRYKPVREKGTWFDAFFRKYLKPDPEKSCIEIGCIPGRYLAFVCREFGYQAFGVDYVEEEEPFEVTRETLAVNDVHDCTLYRADLLTWEPGRKFDVELSVGVVEHFQDPTLALQRHAHLLAPGGLLFLAVPHFLGLQYWLHKILDAENLARHNTLLMDPKVMRRAVAATGLEVLEVSYVGTFTFWYQTEKFPWWKQYLLLWPLQKLIKLRKRLGINWPNRFLSPFLICVARKRP